MSTENSTDGQTIAGAASEQAADLAALQAAAAGAPPAPGAQPEQAEAGTIQPPSAAALQMAAMAVGMLRPIVCFAVPSLRAAPDELWQPIPEGVAAVMDHYGASAEWMQSPWARLGFSLAPLAAFAAMDAMSKPKEAPRVGMTAEAPPAPETPKTVTFGAATAEAA